MSPHDSGLIQIANLIDNLFQRCNDVV